MRAASDRADTVYTSSVHRYYQEHMSRPSLYAPGIYYIAIRYH